MLYQLHQTKKVQGENQSLAYQFSARLLDYLEEFLVDLDSVVDKRLVRTFVDLVGCLIRFRDRNHGLVLSELGGHLLSPPQAAAGTKRISNLLRSPKWSHQLIDHFLLRRSKARISQMLESGETPLILWDESVIEKPESWYSEGLGPVRSAKGKRLKRIKPGYYTPPGGTIHVPGFQWMGIALSGLKQEASIVAMRWWSSRGKAKAHPAIIRDNLIFRLAKTFPKEVIHVFDRGFAGRPLLGQMFYHQQQFILRWPTRFLLNDREGKRKNAWRFSAGRKSMDTTWMEDPKTGQKRKIGLYYTPVAHPDWPEEKLFLVISRPGKNRKPWYLLTNLPIQTHKDAWKVIFSYARRWKIEQVFRVAKCEMGIESPRLWAWENRLKFMMINTLAIDFLFQLLQKGRTPSIELLLQQWCPRTGNRCRKYPTPIYRLRLALALMWNYWLIKNSG